MRPEWPDTALTVEIEKPDGRTFPLRPDDPDPENRPLRIECASKLMEGYSEASFELPREEAVGPELERFDTVRIFGADGRLAWQGRTDDFAPTGEEQSPRIAVTAVGWIAHARDRPMPGALYVDRDVNRWTGPGQKRRTERAGTESPIQGDPEPLPDSEGGVVRLVITGEWTEQPRCEAWYDAGPGQEIGRVYATWAGTEATSERELLLFVAETDQGGFNGGATEGGEEDLYTEKEGTEDFEPEAEYRWAVFAWMDSEAGGSAVEGGSVIDVAPTVYGTHGLTTHGEAPGGLLASDIIAHSAGVYCPKLDTSQLAESSHALAQVAERENIDPYDFWLKLNKYERRHLAVWEERRLYYDPFDFDAVDWRVKDGELGVEVDFEGPATAPKRNGVIVRYQNVETGRAAVITPDDDAELADEDPTIPANAAGVESWEPIQLPDPDSEAGAVRIGKLVLEELNRQRRPGTITVRGCLRDGAHHWQPGWLPKAGEMVLVENRSGGPHLITEPRWDGKTETLTMTVDGQPDSTDAILDQVLTEQRRQR